MSMGLKGNEFVLYKGHRGPASIPDVFQVSKFRNYRRGIYWGNADITGVSAFSDGTAVLSFTSLTGVNIDYCGGGTPVKVGDTVTFPSGTYWDLRLSNGAYIPDINSGYDVSDLAFHSVPTGFIKTITSTGSMYFVESGYNRVGQDMVPALQSNKLVDVLGNPIIYTGVSYRHNFADGIIDYSDTPDPIFNKNAFVGNTYGLPSVWNSDTWSYDDGNPYHWLPSERTMLYLTARLTSAYKNTIMIKEIVTGGTLVGISREEVFDPAISDKNYNILNFIYNGVPIP